MIFAIVSVSLYLWFIREYTNSITLSIYFFTTMGVYTFAMAAIKQTIAVALHIGCNRPRDRKEIFGIHFLCDYSRIISSIRVCVFDCTVYVLYTMDM